ncbi:MAG: histidinol-phosphate transaminase, partial [Gemmataceae bacterium]
MNGLRPAIRAMAGYVPGEQINHPGVIKLNTNENPYPPSPRVFDAIRSCLTGDRLRKYPQPLGDDFRNAAAQVLGVDPAGILIGNGSDDILTILTRSFVPERGTIATLHPSYILYKSLADIQGANLVKVPFSPDWSLPSPWPHRNAHLTIVANPNSPSGTTLRPGDVIHLAKQLNGPLVLDEAYADFAEWNGLSLLPTLSNLIITRTLSKFYALAGIRFGFAITDPATAHELVKVKDSYNCDALSLAAATAALLDQQYYADLRARIVATRGRTRAELTKLGYSVTPSDTNFVWCRRPATPLKPIYDQLKTANILVRHMVYEEYGEGLRITIGTDTEMDRLFA